MYISSFLHFADCQFPDGIARHDHRKAAVCPEEEAQETLPHGDTAAAYDPAVRRLLCNADFQCVVHASTPF